MYMYMYYLLRNTIIMIVYYKKKLVKKTIHSIKYYFYSNVLIR